MCVFAFQRVFAGFQRFPEVFRGFQRFSEVFQLFSSALINCKSLGTFGFSRLSPCHCSHNRRTLARSGSNVLARNAAKGLQCYLWRKRNFANEKPKR